MHSVTLGQFYFCPAEGVRWPFKYCFAFGDGSKQVWINVWICVSCRVPLEVEVWHKDTNSRDQLIGKATIQLSPLLMSERRRFQTWTGQQGWRQTHQDRIPVLKPQQYETFKLKTLLCRLYKLSSHWLFFNHFSTSSVSPTEKVAELSFVATLADLGFLKTREVIVSESLQVRRACLHKKGQTTLPVSVTCLSCFILVLRCLLSLLCISSLEWTYRYHTATVQPSSTQVSHVHSGPHRPRFRTRHPWVPYSSGAGAMEGRAGRSVWQWGENK